MRARRVELTDLLSGVPFEVNYHSPQAAGLVAWWPTIASRGQSVLREIVRGPQLDGVFNGSIACGADAELGAAVNLSGSTTYVQSAFTKATLGSRLTISFWFRHAVTNHDKGIFSMAGAAISGSPWLLLQGQGTPSVRWLLLGGYRFLHPIVLSTWHLISLTYDGATWNSYLNGVAATPYSGALGTGVGTYTFWGSGWNGYYAGRIADARMYNRALSAAEVYQMYDPATRWELYRPQRRFWAVKAAAGGVPGLWPRMAAIGGRGGGPYITPDCGGVG